MYFEKFLPTERDIQRYPHLAKGECFQNSIYECIVCTVEKYKHLKIHRIDDQPIHNLLHFQEIKNALLGENVVAVEIYPKAADFKDGSHTYHLWTWDGIEVPNLALMPKYS